MFTEIATATLIAFTSLGGGQVTPTSTLPDIHDDRDIIDVMWEERGEQLAESIRKQNVSRQPESTFDGAYDSWMYVPASLIDANAIFLPVATNEISSDFGPRSKPCGSCSSWHRGIDFTPGWGEPVYAMSAGEVIDIGFNGSGYGRYVYIEHEIRGETYVSVYAHLTEWGVSVEEGDRVDAGQQIAEVGNTGVSTGAHLHFEIRDEQGEYLDPEEFFEEHYERLTR